ncbi:DHCW motif cupin fold protein [Kitasatospora sp. NPDC004272]
MKLDGFDFTATDWSAVPQESRPGETGTVSQRVQHFGEVRVRLVEYSPGYAADHWCHKGHVLYVLDGELTTTLEDGRVVVTPRGGSYQVADGHEAHRSSTEHGATLLIVD